MSTNRLRVDVIQVKDEGCERECCVNRPSPGHGKFWFHRCLLCGENPELAGSAAVKISEQLTNYGQKEAASASYEQRAKKYLSGICADCVNRMHAELHKGDS